MLVCAVIEQHTCVVSLLLEHGADLHAVDDVSLSIFVYIVFYKYLSVHVRSNSMSNFYPYTEKSNNPNDSITFWTRMCCEHVD